MKTDRKKLIDKMDKIFSLQVRAIGYCEKCQRTTNLQCSHIYSRENKWLRWDKENAFCFCGGCHIFWWHKEPAEAVEWAKNKRNFEYLEKQMQINKPIKMQDLENIYQLLINTNECIIERI